MKPFRSVFNQTLQSTPSLPLAVHDANVDSLDSDYRTEPTSVHRIAFATHE